ncbi:hypothetical protein [Synechococcus sp. W70.1]|jgi:hypothetical protein
MLSYAPTTPQLYPTAQAGVKGCGRMRRHIVHTCPCSPSSTHT